MLPIDSSTPVRRAAIGRLFWATVWLAIGLVSVKMYYLGIPGPLTLEEAQHYLRSLAAISYQDVLFAAGVWACGRAVLAGVGHRRLAPRLVSLAFMSFAAFSCTYAVANVIVFGVFGGFVTYPLLALIGSVRMLSSSVGAHVTPRVILALVALPLTYVALVQTTVSLLRSKSGSWQTRHGVAFASLSHRVHDTERSDVGRMGPIPARAWLR